MDTAQIEKLKALALAATPQNIDSAEDATQPTGYIECPECAGEGSVELTSDYCNYDGKAMGVQFYGVGPEHRAAEAFFRAANPAIVLELIAENERLRARFEYIEDHATMRGGGSGFMVSFFVPVDCEDIGCGIDAAIGSHTKAREAPNANQT